MSAGDITPIRMHRVFSVNCYLVEGADGHVLVDTGMGACRADLERALEQAGCRPGGLRLILLTHGHSDHAGNCAYLREAYGAPIGMHHGDADAARSGDMFGPWSARGPFLRRVAMKAISVTRLGSFSPFEPDESLSDGEDFARFGLDAVAVHLPGHSPGSVAMLTSEGDLFCGDVLVNPGRPEPTSLVVDRREMEASVGRLERLEVRTVYPGHGRPFRFAELGQAQG